MRWMLFVIIILMFQCCSIFDEEPEILLSTIDGEEYYEVRKGAMNARKASVYILEDKADSVNYEIKLDLLDSLEIVDSLWRSRYLKALSKVLKEIHTGDSTFVENKVFSYFIHFPNDLIHHLNNEGFEEIDIWMSVLSYGFKSATKPSDISINSVANATISNCNDCNEEQQKLIVHFINKLEIYE